MKYLSTRDKTIAIEAHEAILQGLSLDGGLYVPERIPKVALSEFEGLTYQETALKIFSLYFDDYPQEDLQRIVRDAYDDKFSQRDIVALEEVEGQQILELFHGPTLAFKDMALSVLPHLMVKAKALAGDRGKTVILTATSGDTGKAALEGFKDIEGIEIIVFYPEGGVSEIQRLQMMTQEGANTHVVALKGNFDEAQKAVKEAFSSVPLRREMAEAGYAFSSANSINIGRLVPQIVYYFHGYMTLAARGAIAPGDKIRIAVPTGNFGNILGAYYAMVMGLPVEELVCASNENNVLTDFINTGEYSTHREFVRTISPSMDILVSSNLERFIFEISGRDENLVKTAMTDLKEKGRFKVEEEIMKKIQGVMRGGYLPEARILGTIRDTYKGSGYLLDPHTAVAFGVAQEMGLKNVLIDSTASPYKFGDAILRAMALETELSTVAETLARVETLFGRELPKTLKGISDRPQSQKRVIFPGEIQKTIKEILKVESTMFKVRVPGTSANIGPGFDTLGMALKIHNEITFRSISEGLEFDNVSQEYANEGNLIYQSMLKTWECIEVEKMGVALSVTDGIPISRGLGSSAACVIAGVLGALKMADKHLSNEGILKIAMEIEGHPDNITPALIGGVTIATSVGDNNEIEYMKLDIKDQYDFYAFIPPFEIATEESRKILPREIPLKDAVHNVSRAAMMVATLISGRQEFLRLSLEDRLHQPYRSKLITGYDELKEYFATQEFLGSFISGAGPTVIAMAEKDQWFGELVFKDWQVEKLNIDHEGARVIQL